MINTINRRPFFWLTALFIFFVFLFLIRGILLPFVLGIFTAYFFNPLVNKLERIGLSRGLGTLCVTVSFFLVVSLAVILIIPMLVDQLSGLIATLPDTMIILEQKIEPQIRHWLGHTHLIGNDNIKSAASSVSGAALKWIGTMISSLFQSGLTLVNLLSLALITPVLTFYLLKDWNIVTNHIDSLLPRAHADTIREQLAIIDRTLAGFLRGQMNVCLALSLYYCIGLSLLGLKFAIIIGILTGFLVILPYVGFLFGMLAGIGVAFFQFDDINYTGLIFLVFMIGQLLESYILTPRLVGDKVGLHPLWIIFGMLAGATMFGFVGILLAVPATAVIGVLIRFATARYLQSNYYKTN